MPGAMTQLQVVYALLLRETKTRFGANQLGYVWAVAQPLMLIGMFALFYRVVAHMAPPGMSMLAFLTTGIVPFSLFRESTQRCLSAIDANKGLLFYPQVRPLDLVIARAVLEAATHAVVLALLMGGIAVYEGPPRIDDGLAVVGGLALASALGLALGLLCCGISVYSQTFERLWPAIGRVLFWTSGIFHPIESLPTAARDVLLLNPVAHAIDLVRDGWFPGYAARHSSPWYGLGWVLVLLFLGLGLERVARRKLELT